MEKSLLHKDDQTIIVLESSYLYKKVDGKVVLAHTNFCIPINDFVEGKNKIMQIPETELDNDWRCQPFKLKIREEKPYVGN